MKRECCVQFSHKWNTATRFANAGIPFRTYMYVPGRYPITGSEFHEREDFAHVHTCIIDFISVVLLVTENG